jgi:hypothetical protein
MAESISVQQDGEAYLTKIILTMTSSSSLSRRLDGGQKEADEDSDDADYDKELNEGDANSSHDCGPLDLASQGPPWTEAF